MDFFTTTTPSVETQQTILGTVLLGLGAIAVLLPFMWSVMRDLINSESDSN